MANQYGVIVVSPEPRGRVIEYIIDGTPKPGTLMSIKRGVEKVGGKFTVEAFNHGADGHWGPLMVLMEDELQGKLVTDAYVDATQGRCYHALPGDELQVLKGDVAGTADDFAIGDLLMIDEDTGKVVLTTGSPEMERFTCLETVVDPAADVLVHVLVN